MRHAGRRFELLPMLWRYDQLSNAHWHEQSVAAALEGDVVVLASTTADAMTRDVEHWIERFIRAAEGRRTTLVVIKGRSDAWTISLEQSKTVGQRAAKGRPALQRLVA